MTLCPIIWADGYGSETLTAYAVTGGDTSFSAGGGRGGRNAVNVGSGGGTITWSDGTTHNRFVGSVAMKGICSFSLMSGTYPQASLRYNGGGGLSLYNGGGANYWSSPSLDFTTYIQVSLGVYYTGSGTMTVTVILNGASTVFSGAVASGVAAAIDGVRLSSATGSNTATFCDLVVQGSATSADTSIGDVACGWITGSGAGASSAWSVTGAASDWQATNESPPDGDTSYISSSTASQKDTMAMTNLSASALTVYAVVPKLYVRKTDAGARTIEPLFHIGGTDYAGTAQGMGTGDGQLYQVYSVSPATSSAWGVSEVNGLELGVELAS